MTASPPATMPEAPLVLALDVGSSSVRTLAFDLRGRMVAGQQREYRMGTTPDGGIEADADDLLGLAVETLDATLADLGSRATAVAGVAASTFWHTVMAVDAEGRATTPLYSWADTRSAREVDWLRARLDEGAYHARTGCPLHTSYLPARLLWLRRQAPAAFRRARRFVSFGEYLGLCLFGEARLSVSMASATGLFDQRAGTWDGPVLEALDLAPERLSSIVDLDAPFYGLRTAYAGRWPVLARVPWFPALGDGACSNVGVGCVGRERAALMVGTSGALRVAWRSPAPSPPPGLWCYRIDGARILVGGALANGGSVYAWLHDTLRLGPAETVERELALLAPDAHGLTLLPFFAGERSPGWVAEARAAVVGLTLATRPLDLLRAGLETVAYRFALIYERLREACPGLQAVVATGGALAASRAWTGILADVLGVPVLPCLEREGSARGAALLALEALRAIPSVTAVPARLEAPVDPGADRHARYQAGLERHRTLYRTLIPFYTAAASGAALHGDDAA